MGVAGLALGDTLCLKDGSILKGNLLAMSAQEIEFETAGGILKIDRKKVEAFTTVKAAPTKTPPPPDAPTLENDFAVYHGPSFYAKRTLGLGFAAGFTSGVGLSAIYSNSPWSFVLAGTPLTDSDGYMLGTQAQFDLVQFRFQRVYTYAGAAVYRTKGNLDQNFGLGLGYGLVVFKDIGLSLNSGFLRDFATQDNGSQVTWKWDVNAMVHFYIF